MELISTRKYSTHDRHFEIHTFRDTNKDSLVLEPVETTSGKKDDVSHLKSYVHMKGIFDLKPEEYADYKDALNAVKQSLNIHVNPSTPK